MGRRRFCSGYLTLCAALCSAGCSKASKPDAAGAPPASAPSGSVAAAASLQAPAAAASDPWEGHPPTPPPPPPPGASASALRSEFRERLTTLRVLAHVGAVTMRKRGSSWVTAGDSGCTVPAGRIDQALDSLMRLKSVKTDEHPADGDAFDLQIVALMGEDVALELDVANHGPTGDLVQLFDGSSVRMRGLDRSFWSPRPADWCKEL